MRFHAPLVYTLIIVLLVPMFFALGLWQLGRADHKRELQAEYDRRVNDATLQIGSDIQRADDLRFYRVMVRGYYETDYQFLHDNRILQGRAGYYVITPLRIGQSRVRVLVNRGWIPAEADRSHLPVIDTPSGLQEIDGVATIPGTKTFMLASPEPLKDQWQPVWQQLDLERFMNAVPFPVQPLVILLAPESTAGGYEREWGRLDAGIAIHQGYAFQWFMLAALLVSIYIILGFRRERR